MYSRLLIRTRNFLKRYGYLPSVQNKLTPFVSFLELPQSDFVLMFTSLSSSREAKDEVGKCLRVRTSNYNNLKGI